MNTKRIEENVESLNVEILNKQEPQRKRRASKPSLDKKTIPQVHSFGNSDLEPSSELEKNLSISQVENSELPPLDSEEDLLNETLIEKDT